MSTTTDQAAVRDIISNGRYLSLATTDGAEPWVAPIEYLHDEALNFYFLSTGDSRHAQHIEQNPTVSIAIFGSEQPAYAPDLSASLNGVQILGAAKRLKPEEHPESVIAAIQALNPPMPPYHVFMITPSIFYLPKVVDGINRRIEVFMR